MPIRTDPGTGLQPDKDSFNMVTRRKFLGGASIAGAAVSAAAVSRVALAAIPEPVSQSRAATQPPLAPPNGRPYRPVVTLNGWTLPWRMRDGV